MDYSKTHYYKYTAPANPKQARSTIPVFEVDDEPATPGFGPAGPVTPELDANIPDEGPTINAPAVPAPPLPPVMQPQPPVYQPSGSITTPSRPNYGSNNNDIFWSFSWLSPIFGNSSVSSVAQARFYNVCTMMEPVDIYINGQQIVSDLDYSEYTDYLYIIPGYYNITIFRRTNPGYPFFSTRVNFARNTVCTISLIGTVDNPGLQFIC